MNRIRMRQIRMKKLFLFLLATLATLWFQNCAENEFQFSDSTVGGFGVEICQGVSCTLDPLTTKPAVTTILIALGDEADSQLVVNGASAQLIAETVIRYSTPKKNPKILLVRDRNQAGEDPEDTIYVKEVLLSRYNVIMMDEPVDGVRATDLTGYDLVWHNNPGHPMGSVQTRDTLLTFAGGVVLQGDDLSRGVNFSLEELTGLRFIDNGTEVVCGGMSYPHDNNGGEQYRVSLDPNRVAGVNEAVIGFRYGNDIDNTAITRPDFDVLAQAIGGPSTCIETRPAIVRYIKSM